jgi:predicted AAA+ superfamily ATPase
LITRTHWLNSVTSLLDESPAVALLGPRQVGKTTLALQVAESRRSIYLDLESPADLGKLADPELYLNEHADELVILDEIHRLPDVFPVLRGLIDKARRRGQRNGKFLILGSAAPDLLRQSGETLAGRIAYVELPPFTAREIEDTDRLWLRGGFPESCLAASNPASGRWRQNFLRTYLERDIPQLGPRIPSETLRRFWTMLAHHQGGVHNAANLARGLAVDGKTIANYLDLLVDLLLVRRLTPWHGNVGKRLTRAPKVYVRDSGLLHQLLGIGDRESLLGHPIVGPSWEGFIIENILNSIPPEIQAHYYRTSAGAEIDLLLTPPGRKPIAIEIKRSLSPSASKGFHIAADDVQAAQRYLLYPGTEEYPVNERTRALNLPTLITRILNGP